MSPTDTQLKQALAKMLPERLYLRFPTLPAHLYWKVRDDTLVEVKDTELLALCREVEDEFEDTSTQWLRYNVDLWNVVCPIVNGLHEFAYGSPKHVWAARHATWQQCAQALAHVKSVEI